MKPQIRCKFAAANFVVILFIIIAFPASADENVIYEADSLYHHIRVVENGNMRGLRFDSNHYQSKIDLTDPLDGHFNYIDLLFAGYLFQPDPDDVLFLGLGGGTAQRLFHNYQPDLDYLSVELDPMVVDVAEEYFFYDRNVMPVEISDARAWLRRNPGKHDYIVQDTYSSNAYGTYIPFHLATLEYFNLVRENLSDDGIFVMNVIGTVYGGEQNRVITSVYRTMHEVFPQLYLFAAEDVQNVVIVASMDEERVNIAELREIAIRLSSTRRGEFPPDLSKSAGRLYDTPPSGLSSGIILTDDYAPVDNLLR